MDQKIFRKEIEQELKKLSRNQVVRFSWLCAVRALPFLGGKGNFKFWKANDRQKHLYATLYALDVNLGAGAAYTHAANAAAAAYAVFGTSSADTTSAADTAAAAAAYAAAAAADASDAAYTLFGTSDVYAAAAAAYTYAYAAAERNYIDFDAILLQDLKDIQNKDVHKKFGSTDLYGDIWNNFQKALKAEGCAYWGRLYQTIFDNKFEIDKEALNRRLNVPREIREQGAAAIANFLEELEKGAKRLNEARIIILGEKGAGKTCLARRLIDPNAPMTTDRESTAGVDTTLWKLKEENINVHIWDFAGHTVTHAVHQFFLSERCLYVIVYDGRTEERNRLEYWLNHMKNFGGDSKAIILVNKRDRHTVDIPINSLKDQYPIEGLYTFSIRDDKADLAAFRDTLTGYIKNNPSWNKLEIPANHFRVKEELENIFVKGEKDKCKEHITKNEFDRIAKDRGIGNIEQLLTGLHALGVSLWYKDMEEFDTLILNPEWISHGVYKIINWVNEEKKYSLDLQDFSKVFGEDADRYPEDKHFFFFNLMINYELAYKTDKEKYLIIPHLLKEDRPKILPDFPVGESLMLRYKAEQPLPPNTISRFIVRHNQEIKKEDCSYLVWRYGVVLEFDNGTIALVREESRTISVSVKGENKTIYISTLRNTLNDIFNSYKSKKPELQYRIERFGQIPDEVEKKYPIWLPDSNVLNQTNDDVPYYDVNTKQHIDLFYTVKNYNITAQTLINGQGNHFLDQSTYNTFNFQDCNLSLQGSLNDLSRSLTNAGNLEDAKELESAAQALEQAEQYKTKEEVKKKGLAGRLKRIADELNNKNSTLHKTVEGIKYGIGIAQDIATGYNSMAQWLGLPQVPKPFTK